MNEHAERFTHLRPLLFTIAYEILGSATEAEDVLQESYLRWAEVDLASVQDTKAYLAQLVTRQALNALRAAARRREDYVGPWLPEPLLVDTEDASADVVLAESVSMAMLVVLETLSPLERTVFVLHEAFGYSYGDIAEILDRTPPTVRQLAHRAREHVQARRPRYETDTAKRRAATERFLQASVGGDLGGLLELLAPEAVLWADAGGKAKAPRRPILGADKIARFFVGISDGMVPQGATVVITEVNGGPAVVLETPAGPVAVAMVDLDPDSGLITVIRLLGNPDKMTGVAADRSSDPVPPGS